MAEFIQVTEINSGKAVRINKDYIIHYYDLESDGGIQYCMLHVHGKERAYAISELSALLDDFLDVTRVRVVEPPFLQ